MPVISGNELPLIVLFILVATLALSIIREIIINRKNKPSK